MSTTKVTYSMMTGVAESANVQNYGADPTGSADSTSAIQSAISTGKLVYFPKGTYKITNTLVISSPYQRFIGEARTGTTINNTNASVYAFKYHSALNASPYDIDTGMTFENLTINSKYGIELNQTATNATITVTIASPAVVTWSNHGLSNGDQVYFKTTGSMPTGISTGYGAVYYVTNKTTNTFELSLTSGGASIQTTGSQSGVHTGYKFSAFNLQGHPKNVRIIDCTFQGDNSCYTVDVNQGTSIKPTTAELIGYGVGLHAVKLFDSLIQNCYFVGLGIGVYFEGCDINNIDTNRFVGNSRHVHLEVISTYGGQTKIQNNDVLENRRIGGVYDTCFHTSVKDNYFETYTAAAQHYTVTGGFGHLFTQNRIDNSGQTTPILSLAPSYGMIVSENRWTPSATTAPIQILNTNYQYNLGGVANNFFIKFIGNSGAFNLPAYPFCEYEFNNPRLFNWKNPKRVSGNQATEFPFKISENKSGTVTTTIASPCVVTWTAHGLANGDIVYFTTTGSLPTGLTVNTNYYVVNSTTNTFNVSATLGGTAINTSGSQSGTHTCFYVVKPNQWVCKSNNPTLFVYFETQPQDFSFKMNFVGTKLTGSGYVSISWGGTSIYTGSLNFTSLTAPEQKSITITKPAGVAADSGITMELVNSEVEYNSIELISV